MGKAKRSKMLFDLKRHAGLEGVPNGLIAAVAIVIAILLALAVWKWLPSASRDEFVPDLYGANAAESSSTPQAAVPSQEATSSIKVYVVGAVRRSGVFELPGGSRVADALDAAGGVSSEAEVRAINLAQVVEDGMQIVVPTVDEAHYSFQPSGAASASSASPGAGQAQGAASGPVNINTADATVLQTLPGVGPQTAQKIISDRQANGPFASPEDIKRVSGIGDKKYESIKDMIVAQ